MQSSNLRRAVLIDTFGRRSAGIGSILGGGVWFEFEGLLSEKIMDVPNPDNEEEEGEIFVF